MESGVSLVAGGVSKYNDARFDFFALRRKVPISNIWGLYSACFFAEQGGLHGNFHGKYHGHILILAP